MRIIPKKIKLVAFDLDGTLVDAYQAITDSINYMLRKMGRKPQTLRIVKRSVGWGVDGLIEHFIEKERAVEALAIFRQHHDQRLRKKLKLLPGARRVLADLKKRGCLLAIASNRPTVFCRIILKQLEIDHYFSWVVCGDQVRRAKPYPDILNDILKKAKVRPSEAVYVGDMTVDILCGKRARVFTIAVPTGSCSRKEIMAAKPDLVMNKLSQFSQLFE